MDVGRLSIPTIYDPVMDVKLTFGEWLRDRIADARMRQKEVAAALGVVPQTVSQWVNDIQPPDRRYWDALARVLEVPVEEIASRIAESGSSFSTRADRSRTFPLHERPEAYIPQVLDLPVLVPVLGRAPADVLRWTGDDIRGEFVPQDDLRGIGAPAIVIASGDCLAGRGIYDGMRVLIDRMAMPSSPGDIIVVRVGDDVTMKEWYPAEGGFILRATDPETKPIFVSRDRDDVLIYGVGRRWIRTGEL